MPQDTQSAPLRGDELLTYGEVADLLKVTVKTVQRMVARGDLEAIKVGPRLVRIRAADVPGLFPEGVER